MSANDFDPEANELAELLKPFTGKRLRLETNNLRKTKFSEKTTRILVVAESLDTSKLLRSESLNCVVRYEPQVIYTEGFEAICQFLRYRVSI